MSHSNAFNILYVAKDILCDAYVLRNNRSLTFFPALLSRTMVVYAFCITPLPLQTISRVLFFVNEVSISVCFSR